MKASKSFLFYSVTVISTLVLVLSADSGNPIISLALFAFLVPLGFLMPEALIPVFFIASLSSNYFMAAPGVGTTRLLALILIACVVFRLITRGKRIQTKWIFNLIIILVVTLVSFLSSYDGDFTEVTVIGLNILVFLAISNLPLTQDKLSQLFRGILIAVLITTFYYLITVLIKGPYFLQSNGRLTISDSVNENRFAMMMAQMSAFCLAYVFFTKKIIVRVTCLAVGVVNAYFLLLTGSRSALIGIAMGFLFSILIAMFVQKKITKSIFGIVIFCLAMVVIFSSVIESNPVLAHRMNIDTLILTNGVRRWPRLVGEIQYVIPNRWLFGVGLGANNEQLALAKYINDPGSSHNFIFSALTQLGFLGFAAYMWFYWKVIRDSMSNLSSQKIMIIPLMLILTAIFNGIGEVIFSERFFWNALSLAVLCISTIYTTKKLNTYELPGVSHA